MGRECLKFRITPQENKDNHLLYQKDGFLARIILNRPEKNNAFSLPMIRKWAEALQDAQEDQNIRVIVVTAMGKAFSAGGDIDAMLNGKGFVGCDDQGESWGDKAIDRKRALTSLIHKIALTLDIMDKPVICGINGMAIGAGLDMALMCDIRVVADDAQLSASYVKAGLVPGDGGAFYLPRLVGVAKALEILWTGDFISAYEAEKMGMVNKVVPALELEQATLELARKIADSPPVCVQMIKRAVYSAQRTNDLRTALDLISSQMAIVSEMSDHREGLAALKEKRKPIFTGH
ncbi:enoyl-CoA hydratase/isomerase family protein [Desulfosporosinus sp. BICA1-9]|uniref:enoyl-CoA hydratase/isomerase family protein n=1 Tax=Desulfosporosinus sp. BICA1-9 TaxID=1531958 RepID=UPI0005F0FB6A|nr:enoyl-CoA hydratase-related protein [Desulfosporosinus sp. BICA1-9]KJS48273.1 MAG: enoyl-CoA hydratase [Peptococcaceae bacterium BRH_c23]KJS88853.1 MAG: enoyl-CoA hydratase [Desulfosporosinus sp. BICA1-9]HBW37281.1 enoyl-CoA hydratase [Desulfosporosinus sp.]